MKNRVFKNHLSNESKVGRDKSFLPSHHKVSAPHYQAFQSFSNVSKLGIKSGQYFWGRNGPSFPDGVLQVKSSGLSWTTEGRRDGRMALGAAVAREMMMKCNISAVINSLHASPFSPISSSMSAWSNHSTRDSPGSLTVCVSESGASAQSLHLSITVSF